jgi:anaerobic magnesium-protoporphyrin IX monomethyl ester cyclase
MSKVLLINPPIKASHYLFPPLGLGYLGSALKSRGYEVKVFDYRLRSRFEDYNPDWVGITGFTVQYPVMKEIAAYWKSKGKKVIMGGVHVSALPEYTLKDCPSIDYVIKGEGETAFPDLIGGKIGPGVYSRDLSIPSEYIQDLDSLVSPWKTLSLKEYSDLTVCGIASRQHPVASIISSRGCPYGCSFCSASVVDGKRIRYRSPENFLSELDWLVRTQGIKEINIQDDNFTFDYDRTVKIVQGMLDLKLKFTWVLANGLRADRVDEKLLTMMRKSGCYYFGVGVETGSKELLKTVNKGLDLRKVQDTVKIANRLGFITQSFLIAGLPGEKKSDVDSTIKLVSSIPLDRISINPLMVLPGSRLFNEYPDYDWLKASRDLQTVTPFVRSSIRRIYIKFYLNPRWLFRYTMKLRTMSEWKGLFNGLKIFIGELSRTKYAKPVKEIL